MPSCLCSYHGFWPTDFYKTNPEFGSEEDLEVMLREFRNRGAWSKIRRQGVPMAHRRQHQPKLVTTFCHAVPVMSC